MRFRVLAATMLAAAVSAVAFGGTPAQAAAPIVRFSKIYYDSPGKDTRTNASLNAEWVRITNTTKKPINLKGWTIRDTASHVYTFKVYTLKAGQSVTVHTGKGTNGKPAGNLYWGSGNYIWNNPKDTATLKNAAGKKIDICGWTKDRDVTTC